MITRCDTPELSRNGHFSPYRCTLAPGHAGPCKWSDSPVTTSVVPAWIDVSRRTK